MPEPPRDDDRAERIAGLAPDAVVHDTAQVRAIVEAVAFPATPGATDRVGVEVELFPLRRNDRTRVPIEDHAHGPGGRGLLHRRPDLWTPDPTSTVVPRFTHALGGEVTFEPGGQVEYATTVATSVNGALDEADRATADLATTYADADSDLVGVGVDVWNDASQVPQQLRGPRYPAMSAYFASRGAEPLACLPGAPAPFEVMMRHTAALQISLDLGEGATATERWAVSNLLAPFAIAAFAASPGTDGVAVRNARAAAWHALDPTRTGFAPGVVASDGGPSTWDGVAQVTDGALRADVLLFRQPDGGGTQGRPGLTFADWMAGVDPALREPTVADVAYHLTTLFHEVRPRGAIEVRSVDALPHVWRAAPVVLYAGALYDQQARERLLELLTPLRAELDVWRRRAFTDGVADPAFCAIAVSAWSYALDGARRLGPAFVAPRHLAVAERFIDRFTTRGRAPSDELRDALARHPRQAARWAAEPLADQRAT